MLGRKQWPPDEEMQELAAKLALSETAYIIEQDKRQLLRWFTPKVTAGSVTRATSTLADWVFISDVVWHLVLQLA